MGRISTWSPNFSAASLMRAAALGAVVAILAYFSLVLPQDTARAAPIWLANAVVLTVLLRTPTPTWWLWVTAGFAGYVAANFAVGDAPVRVFGLAACNSLEALGCGIFLRRMAPEGLNMGRPRHLILLSQAAVVASVLCALAATAIMGLTTDIHYLSTLMVWIAADALGLMIVTPCLLSLLDPREGLGSRRLTSAGTLALLFVLAVNIVIFGIAHYPLLFLAVGVGLAASIALETLGAAVAVIITTAVAVGFTFAGVGPIMAYPTWTERLIVLQVFLTMTAGLNLHVAAITRKRRTALEELEAARNAAQALAAGHQQVADNATDIISRAKLSGEMTYVSAGAAAVTGFTPEELVGQLLEPRVHPDDRAVFLDAHIKLVSGERQPGTPLRYRVIHKDGSWVWLEANPSVAHDADGRATEFISVSRDVTERVELETRLDAMRVEAEQAARVKSEFLANMSHEIRTPLTSILGFASLLSERNLGEEPNRYVNRVVVASRSLLAIVNDVLDFSKLEAGRLELKPRPTDPHECAQEVLELFGAQAEAKGLSLHFESEGPHEQVLADPDRLRQLLMNLVGNAVKFTPAGSVTVKVRYQPRVGRLTFRIVDTGPGLVRGAREKLFQRFSQVDASTTRAHGGTGLGLAICKGLVDAMGGTIGVTSRKGKGATFWFEVPVERAGIAGPAAPEMADVAAMLVGLRVLVTDDNPANLELVRSLLTPMGVAVATASGGAEAVEAAREAPFDVILMDLRMPGVDGWAAANAIRSGDGPNKDVPILAFSADISADRHQISEVFQDVVRKPVELAELLRAVARWSGAIAWDQEEATADAACG